MLFEETYEPLELTDEDKTALLKLARGTLTGFLETGKKPTMQELGLALTPGMKSIAGAFVTLHLHGNLRGCIGEIFPERELYQAVSDHALNAGLRDPRFPSVRKRDLPQLVFEISALTAPKPVASWHDIELGVEGMVMTKDGHSAVFLPQVAPEQGWDLPTTLANLSLKAGLAPDDYKHDAQFEVFEAIVFSEDEKP